MVFKSVIKVLSEGALIDGLKHVHIGGGNHANVGLLGLAAAHTDELPGLQDAQQAHLGGQRQFAHLVQEDRTTIGHFEVALARFMRSGEGALLVTEQLAVDGAFWNGAAVHCDVRTMLACAVRMNDLGHHLLAGTALPGDQDTEVRGGHLGGDLDGACPDPLRCR
jgi:hypothetical protein